jgi:hypothetical protein
LDAKQLVMQEGHVQSPSRLNSCPMPLGIWGSCPITRTFGVRGALQRKHAWLLANTLALQAGHVQSPGRGAGGSLPPPPLFPPPP